MLRPSFALDCVTAHCNSGFLILLIGLRRLSPPRGVRGGPPSQAPVGGSTLQHFLGILAYRECRINQSEAAVRATGGLAKIRPAVSTKVRAIA